MVQNDIKRSLIDSGAMLAETAQAQGAATRRLQAGWMGAEGAGAAWRKAACVAIAFGAIAAPVSGFAATGSSARVSAFARTTIAAAIAFCNSGIRAIFFAVAKRLSSEV